MYQLTISGCLGRELYLKLLKRLLNKSDSFIFHLPNMGKTLVNERNIVYMPEYQLGYSNATEQDKHEAYKNCVKKYLDIIREDIIFSRIDTGYLDQISNIEMEVFCATISERTETFFAQTDDFMNWKYPSFPEDPCFFLKEKCLFQCIAHEGICLLNYYDPVILSLLEKDNIEFYRSM